MEMKITTLEGKEAGSVKLPDAIFGLEPRTDIIQRCVNWQLAKRQRGTHKTKGRAEIWRTGKKMYAQKGTGGARHGSRRAAQFVGGGARFGVDEPVVMITSTDTALSCFSTTLTLNFDSRNAIVSGRRVSAPL